MSKYASKLGLEDLNARSALSNSRNPPASWGHPYFRQLAAKVAPLKGGTPAAAATSFALLFPASPLPINNCRQTRTIFARIEQGFHTIVQHRTDDAAPLFGSRVRGLHRRDPTGRTCPHEALRLPRRGSLQGASRQGTLPISASHCEADRVPYQHSPPYGAQLRVKRRSARQATA